MSIESSEVRVKGEEILKRMEAQSRVSLFSKDYWYGSIMDWSMKNEQFKTQMFRFVDVLPYLNSGTEVARHLKEYFADAGEKLPPVFNVGLGMGSLAPSLMAGAIRKNVTAMAKMFITGENPAEALPVLKKTRKQRLAFTVDLLGEATLSEKEALEYQAKYLELIDGLANDAAKWDEVPLLDRDENGPIPRVNVSVKMTALYSQINDMAWDDTKEKLKERLRPIYRKAMERGVFLTLDMEHYGVKDLTLEVFREIVLEPEFRDYRFFGCVIQCYLRDSLADCRKVIAWSRERGTPLNIRLVKGAYWDSETIEAEQKRWPYPVYLNKAESDANYEDCTAELLKAFPTVRVAFGSHNVRSIAFALVTAERLKIPQAAVEIQMLYGMADPIKKSLADMGYRVREYAPVGELIPGMAYLVRRLLENTSNESWLRGKFAEEQSTEKLLRDPKEGLVRTSPELPVTNLFENEALLDFAVEGNRVAVDQAVKTLRRQLPVQVPVVINGQDIRTQDAITRENPAHPAEVVGHIQMSGPREAEMAVEAAKAAFPAWRRTPAAERATLVDRLAELMLRDRMKLIAAQVLEVGKPWAEADADVCEAIDFCRYYARDMRRLAAGERVGHALGEISIYHYEPRGVSLVIAPWNFPLAILTGMVAGALVTGNTVVMKPAEQSSVVAYDLMRLLREAGFPPGVAHFLPGIGEVVGEALVNHKDIATIAFTGSKAVGLHILQRAAVVQPGQRHVKRCIIEMGGKNAIIVDSDADLDEAVDAILYSAFGFAGQKCSAASRVIVLEENYDKFESRLIEAARSLRVGPSEDPRSYFGPVVDSVAQIRILQTIEKAKTQHKLLFEGEVQPVGYFVPPTIFGDVDPKSEIAQNEIFGPVVALIRAKDLDHALEIANGTEYGLTGGVYSRSPAHIEKVRREFQVGNLYINRGITGALVDRHPFGGFKMSGLGSKTGGPDYLKGFMEPRVVTENTVRRGFAPQENLAGE